MWIQSSSKQSKAWSCLNNTSITSWLAKHLRAWSIQREKADYCRSQEWQYYMSEYYDQQYMQTHQELQTNIRVLGAMYGNKGRLTKYLTMYTAQNMQHFTLQVATLWWSMERDTKTQCQSIFQTCSCLVLNHWVIFSVNALASRSHSQVSLRLW